ncbi:MAG: hypothetical protein Q8M03_01260 [Legionella sp.]|nr:hypothetical protein [Legionella sp.]
MRNSKVKKCLDLYDANKGHWRMIVDESHVRELRSFVEQVKGEERSLLPTELLDLAKIILGKEDREGKSESSKTFEKLADYFGGYIALEALEANQILTAEYVAFLAENFYARILSGLLVSLNKKTPPGNIQILIAASQKMVDREKILNLFREMEKRSENMSLSGYLRLLNRLIKYHLIFTDDLPFLLLSVHWKKFSPIEDILKTLEESNPALLTLKNVTRILELKYPHRFNAFLRLLPVTKDTLNYLFGVADTLEGNYLVEYIFRDFKAAGWEITPYLSRILPESTHSGTLAVAIKKLGEVSISSKLLPIILTEIFDRAEISIELVESVVILSEANLLEKHPVVFGVSTQPKNVARALVMLAKENLYNKDNVEGVCACPLHATGIASLLIQLHKAKCTDLDVYQIMSAHPDYAQNIADVLEVLEKSGLLSEANIVEVCKIRLAKEVFSNLPHLLLTLNKANLLSQANLSAIFEKLAYIKTLTSATTCLANGDVLSQYNFDLLLMAPTYAHFIAEEVGGQPYPLSYSYLEDKGATSFMQIRLAALALAKEKGIFSPVENELASNEELFVKIVEDFGGALEKETAETIAKEAYFSFERWR